MNQITMKEAVAKAKSHLLELYEDDAPRALALEEIDKFDHKNKQVWAVTMGFYRQRNVSVTKPPGLTSVRDLINPSVAEIENRVYKTVLIDAQTGEFVKMDMRQVS